MNSGRYAIDPLYKAVLHIRVKVAGDSHFKVATVSRTKVAGPAHFKVATYSHPNPATIWQTMLGRDIACVQGHSF
jgi:hypothetical protein